ncbi:hypothetical protein L9G74_19095 [Shewanella sp. C32]|uniref:Uncharacterized protein n=1 Tax=Shewanella electrica TaxID=515560 RepID=A0ABT2FQE0_9GAMM|nr:hypothetical protein [Shewanella electrica]MCS4558547.1 hypothetical protein [Shewanella electrica]
MESINNSSKEFRGIIWSTTWAVCLLLTVWKVLSLLQTVVEHWVS